MIKIPTVQDVDSGNFEKTKLFLNTKTLTVYFEGIVGDQFSELIEDMVNQVNFFSFYCSVLIIGRIGKLQISFAALSPLRAGSYLELPDALSAASSLPTKSTLKMMTVAFSAALLPHITTWMSRPSTSHLDGGRSKTKSQPTISTKKELWKSMGNTKCQWVWWIWTDLKSWTLVKSTFSGKQILFALWKP